MLYEPTPSEVALRAEIERLQGRIDQLEADLNISYTSPPEWHLTPAEMRIFGALLARESCSKDALMAAVYRNDGRDEADPKIINVFVCKMRKKLKPHGITIHTHWGYGYYLDPVDRERLR